MSTREITTKADEAQNTRRFVVDDFKCSPLEADGLPEGSMEARCIDDGVYVVTVGQVVPHSQLGQDLWVLAQLNYKQSGTFVDVGAHDGIHFSNTYLLETDYQWTGVCVECSDSYPELKANRKAKCLPYAAWSTSGQALQFNQHESTMLSSVGHGSRTVATLSLNDICQGLGPIDYLSLDTEGSEAEILSTFDFDKYQPKCMTIEHNNDAHALSVFIDLFKRHGYLWRMHHWDVLAVRDAWRG